MDDLPTEILIHITAASRAGDDARYRDLATAYVDFDPTARVRVVSLESSSQQLEIKESQSPKSVIQPSAPKPEPSILLGTPLDSYASPQASFRSVIDNFGSPRVARQDQHTASPRSVSSAIQSSWQPPSSLVGDSQPNTTSIHASLVSPTRLLEHYIQGFGSFHSSSPSPTHRLSDVPSSSQQSLGTSTSPRVERSLDPAPKTEQPSDPIPASTDGDESQESSISISLLKPVVVVSIAEPRKEVSTSGEQHGAPAHAKLPADGTSFNSSKSLTIASRADSEPLPTQKDQVETTRALHQALSRATSDLGPRSSTSEASISAYTNVAFFPTHGYSLQSLELKAPEPPVSSLTIDPGKDLVTPYLRQLLTDARPRRKSQPREQLRALRPTERGYWKVDCSAWDPELKRATWAHLANWVGMGYAGWGTRCTRDQDFLSMRVYCWGETAPYLYYLLWLTSYRKILAADCAWIDASGVAVLIMGMRK